MNWLFERVIEAAGVPDKDVADLERNLPALARLCAASRELEPLVHEAMPHLEALKPIAEKAFDILEKAYPDLVAVLPTFEEFIQFANNKGK
jgi:hypothetical protein